MTKRLHHRFGGPRWPASTWGLGAWLPSVFRANFAYEALVHANRFFVPSASQAALNARGPSAPPGRSANHAAEIAAPEGRVLVRKHVGLHVSECRVGLVFDAVVERLDDVFLELLGARMRVHDRFACRVAVFGIGQPQHVHLDAGRHQSDDGVHVLRDARRRVQSDRRPDRIDVVLANAVTAEEVAGGVRAVDLEALVGAAVRRGQAHVVKHRPRIEKLAIELETTMLSGERTPVIDAARMVEQQRRLGIPDELRDLTGESSVGDAGSFHPERPFSRKCQWLFLPNYAFSSGLT